MHSILMRIGRPIAAPSGSDRPDGLIALGSALFLDPPEALQAWADLLLESRQLIFQSPPGTGKTFIAKKLAAATICPT